MKKQTTKKLSIQRETLTPLAGVTGGSYNNTVYYPPPSNTCLTNQQQQIS